MQPPKHTIFFPFFLFTIINLTVLSLFRFAFAIWQAERVTTVNGWLDLFIQGMRIDLVTICYLFGTSLFLTLFLGSTKAKNHRLLAVWLTICSTFIFFMELATPAFIQTYDFRPNRLFIEYLNYPKEVATMLWQGHSMAVIFSLIFTVLSALLYWKLAKWATANLVAPSWKKRPLVMLLVAALTFIGARSSFAHRGINPAMVAFSSDPLVNSLVLNSGYSVLYAVQQLKNEDKSAQVYGKMDESEMLRLVKQANPRPETAYLSDELPTLTHNPASFKGKRKNIVIILQESQGAQFIGTLGGKPLSPEFDKLAQEGWLFENLYATGTRSVRGIEAVTAGFLPTPARATVKLTKSQNGFFTIAELLKRQGYHTSFIYGGEKHFDNMASYFYGNGFSQIIDEKDYKDPKFKGTWGMSDEDLFDKAHETFSQWAKEDKPFFSLVFTSSNHDPFEFPDGKIDLYEEPKATRNNTAKYADYALGHFFKLAKKSAYWQDTVFLVIADHDSRVAGESLMPIKHFHIPALLIGEHIAPRRDSRLVSQIDMPTTLLSVAGVSGDYPMIGADLTQAFNPNRAIMQYDQTQAMMVGKEVVIMQPNQPAKGFIYDKQNESLTPTELSQQLKDNTLAHALLASFLYQKGLYKLPMPQ